MIPTLALIVAVYAVARLLQVPMEALSNARVKLILLTIVSITAIVAISVLTFSILMSAVGMSDQLNKIPLPL